MSKIKTLYNKCFCDETGKLTLAQFPNISGGLTVGFIVLSWLLGQGALYNVARGAAAITGLWWAYLEIRYGVNYFRRVLGAYVVFVIIRAVAESLWR
jgi:hypothetical protein